MDFILEFLHGSLVGTNATLGIFFLLLYLFETPIADMLMTILNVAV